MAQKKGKEDMSNNNQGNGQNKAEKFTAKDNPQFTVSGILCRGVKVRDVQTKNGPSVVTRFTLLVDMERVEGQKEYPPGRFLDVELWGEYPELAAAAESGQRPKVAATGRLKMVPESVGRDGKVWPARLDLAATHIFAKVDKAPEQVEAGFNEVPF